MRIGHGYDVHRLVKGRKLIIGGCTIPNEMGLLGHSDADVLLHAIMDSLLGAASLPNIGELFCDEDPKYKNANSLDLLFFVNKEIKKKGYSIVNIDSTVIAEEPKLSNYIKEMKENIAKVCKIPIESVNIKATTEEGLGFSGKLEGIAAHSVCLLEQKAEGR